MRPVCDGIREASDKIRLCEDTYGDHGLTPVFEVAPMVIDLGLDDLLAY